MTDECQTSNLFISSVCQFQLLVERVELVFFSPAPPSIIGRHGILPHATHKVRLSNYGCKFLFYDIISHHWQLKLLFLLFRLLAAKLLSKLNGWKWQHRQSLMCFCCRFHELDLRRELLLLLNTGYPARSWSFGVRTLSLSLCFVVGYWFWSGQFFNHHNILHNNLIILY